MTTNTFSLYYNVTGPERKRLVKAISEYTGADAEYLGAPTFSYMVDYFTIDRNGVVSFDSRADTEEIEGLIKMLLDKDFVPEYPPSSDGEENADTAAQEGGTAEETAAPDTTAEDGSAAHSANMGLTVRMPLDKVSVGNLTRLLEVKGSLIKNALGIADLPISIEEDTVAFPWFEELPSADEVNAYTHLIAALCEMSRKQKRITATEKEVENEKYAFRCFLLRLGFIGAEFKTERKILLRNLSGSSAFKSGHKGGAEDAVSE